MKTQILPQLSKYLNTTPAYTPRGKVERILSIVSEEDDDIEIEGELPNLYIPNREEGVNGGGFSDTVLFEIPFGRNKKTGKQVVLTANCTVTLTVDDWGSVSIDGEKVVNHTPVYQ